MVKAGKLICVITARPSYARIKTALESLAARHINFDIVCAASSLLDRYGSVVEQIWKDGFSVGYSSLTQIEGDDPAAQARTMALTTLDLATYFANTEPMAVITIADRYETLATAVAASYMNIPLIHIQGGEVTGCIDDKVRNAVTQLADLHLVSTPNAAKRVRQMKPGAEVGITGCPSLDIAATLDDSLITELPGTGSAIDLTRPFILVLQHPETEHPTSCGKHAQAIQKACELAGLPVVWFWPNVDSGSDGLSKAIRTWKPRVPVHFVRQVPPQDFLRLMRQCAVMVGNSSAGIREGALLGTPVVNVGSRQHGRERARNVSDVPPESPAILRAIQQWSSRPRPEPAWLYGDGTAGLRIADAILTWLRQRLDHPSRRHLAV